MKLMLLASWHVLQCPVSKLIVLSCFREIMIHEILIQAVDDRKD